MDCIYCDSAAVTEGSDGTAQDYRRFRYLGCDRQFNERSAGMLNWTQYPSDVIARWWCCDCATGWWVNLK